MSEYSVELDGAVFNIKIGPTLKPAVEIEKPLHPIEEARRRHLTDARRDFIHQC